MNARSITAPERGLILLIAIALLASGIAFFVGREAPPPGAPNEPIVLENVLVVRPTFRDVRKVDLNTASADELVRLPGIGEVLAGRIIAYRKERGRFTSIDGLLAVSGIGPKVLEQLRDQVTVDAEAGQASSDQ